MEIEQGKMILKNLTLKNYRAFENLNIEFHDRLTVIVGVNGAGKTTILDAAAAALSAYIAGFDGLGLYKISPDDARVKCIELGDMVDAQPQYPVEIDAAASVYYPRAIDGMNTRLDRVFTDEPITWKRLRNSASSHARQNTKDIAPMQKVGTFYQACIRIGDGVEASIITAPVLAYYSTRRFWKNDDAKDMLKTNISRQDAYKECLDAHLSLSTLKTWFERMTYKGLQSGKMSKTFLAVRKAIAKVFGDISNSTEVDVGTNLDTKEIEIKFKDINGEWNCLTLNQLSDGYKGTICLIADIAYRMAVLNPQLEEKVLEKTGGIVLIDEVDQHLHPAWQQRILADLMNTFPQVQFIVSTHAPAVVNTVKSESIAILENGTVRTPDGEVYGKDVSSIVKGIMNGSERPDNVKKLFARFYSALSDKRYEDAQSALDELDATIEDDPELAACHTKFILKKRMG